MFAVYGTLLFCGGLLLFFVMLHFHRRPGAARWLESRATGEITVFICMMAALMGFALIGRFFIQLDTQVFGILEALVVTATLIGSYYIIRKTYLPPPAAEASTPAVGTGNGNPQTTAPASRPLGRRKAV